MPKCSFLLQLLLLLPLFRANKLVLISLDGFRWDYLDRDLPLDNLRSLAKSGIRAKWMTNQFQTKTFPNHWTLATGLYEEAHGLIGNYFYDVQMNASFTFWNQSTWRRQHWGGEPIWITNQNAGFDSAVQFWPGSEQTGQLPTYFRPFEMFYPFRRRVDNLIRYLKLDRTTLGVMYFEEPDYTGHKYGPDSVELDAKLVELDEVIGYFVEEMKRHALYNDTNIIITSDHGMGRVEMDKIVDVPSTLHKMIDFKRSRFSRMTGLIYPKSVHLYGELKLLEQKEPALNVWRKSDIPSRLHFRHHRRIPPIVLTVNQPWSLKVKKHVRQVRGDHGWMFNESGPSDMFPIFVARGPSIKKTPTPLDPIENVSVYLLCCKLLNLHPAPNNGSLTYLSQFLKFT